MNIQELQSSNQSELYRIRKNTAQQTEAAEAEKISQQLTEQQPAQVDEYDKANPVGEEVKGIYSVSRDEEGNLKVNYTQPAESESKSKSENEKDSEKVQASGNSGKSQGASGVQQTSESESEDSSEEEVEKLKKQRDAIKAQLRSEQDEAVKSQLRTQLQNIEAQIALKSASINS